MSGSIIFHLRCPQVDRNEYLRGILYYVSHKHHRVKSAFLFAAGKLNKFFKDNTLLPQAFVKDNGKTVGDHLTSVSKGLTVTTFKRLAVGA